MKEADTDEDEDDDDDDDDEDDETLETKTKKLKKKEKEQIVAKDEKRPSDGKVTVEKDKAPATEATDIRNEILDEEQRLKSIRMLVHLNYLGLMHFNTANFFLK